MTSRIQQFPPPLLPPAIQGPGDIEPMLAKASEALNQKNAPLALACFRAVMIYCRSAFLRGEVISGDMQRIAWQMMDMAIAARHFIMALSVARQLYIDQAGSEKQKFFAAANWLQLLIKLQHGWRAKKLAKQLQESLPASNQGEINWINIQLADMAMQEGEFAKATKLLSGLNEANLSKHDKEWLWRINSFSYLHMGDYGRGFHFYEHRAEMADPAFPYFKLNLLHDANKKWAGQATGTLLITAEQGLGDVLQFVRFLPALQLPGKPLAKKIIFEVPAPLISLLQQSRILQQGGTDIELLPFDDKPSVNVHPTPIIDHWCLLNSLPFLLQEKIPQPLDEKSMLPFYQPPQSYLTPLIPKDKDFFSRLPSFMRAKKYKVGVVWATSVGGPSGVSRTMALKDFWPLFANNDIMKSVDFYSLQLGLGQKEISAHGMGGFIYDISPAIKDFADSADIVKELDLVIAVDTAILHLAGGLKKHSFVLLPQNHDWRWGRPATKNWHGIKEAGTSFWYPETHVVFRQEKMGDWHTVVNRVGDCLLAFLNKQLHK